MRTMKYMRLMCGLAVLVAGSAEGTVLNYPVTTDTYLDSQSPTVNFGAATTVKVLINSSDGSICRGLFTLPPEIGSLEPAKVAKVVVCFYVFSDQTAGRTITLFPLTRAFSEGTGAADGATWLTYDGVNAWTNTGGDFDTGHGVIGRRGANGYFRWDITALLEDGAIRTNLLNYGALLRIDEVPPPVSGTPRAPFTSSDNSAAERPYVEVTLGEEVQFAITTDTYVDSRSSNTSRNYGVATTVKTVVNSSDASVCRGFFRLPPEVGLYTTDQIARATVLLYVWQDNTAERNITLFPLTQAFVEGTGNGTDPADGATWTTYDGTNVWTSPGGDFDTNYPITGVKEPILDPDLNDRYFRWDITALLTDGQARSELLDNGALLRLDEVPLPSSGMPRAPFTSSDDLSYTAAFRPRVELLVIPRTVDVQRVTIEDGSLVVALTNCTPFITNRIERTFDLLQPNGWIVVTSLVTSGHTTNWAWPLPSGESNAFYRLSGAP